MSSRATHLRRPTAAETPDGSYVADRRRMVTERLRLAATLGLVPFTLSALMDGVIFPDRHPHGFTANVIQAVLCIVVALLTLLIDLKRQGKTIAAYGAPAKGNTLLNYCGIGADILEFTVDRSPAKAGLFLPGTRLPILHPEVIDAVKPDYLLILPWNIRDEIMDQMAHIRGWGGKFIVPIPTATVIG